jgi:hypothetical protein
MSGRPGHHIARQNKGHPRRQARRDRAEERLAARPAAIACDYCDEGVPLVNGGHETTDPEGWDAGARIPCPRAVR